MILTGRVIDDISGEPLDGVNIEIVDNAGQSIRPRVYSTDADGVYLIDLGQIDQRPALLFSRAAFEKAILQPEDYRDGGIVELKRTGSLDEVVVSAKRNKKLRVFDWVVLLGIAGKIFHDQSK